MKIKTKIEDKFEFLKSDKFGPLYKKSFLFSIRIVKSYQYLKEEKKEFTICKQLLKSGTNPGAMIREAINAESKADFIHKLSIAQKEIAETFYWLELLYATDYLIKNEFQSLNDDTVEILKMLKSSIKTKKKNLKK